MSSAVPYLPPVLETINQIVTSKTIPELNKIERSDITYYLFKHANKQLRLAIAETAYRNHKRPRALDLFLSCVMPLAERWAARKAQNMFIHPSDWQIECFYSGAVSAILKTFHNPFPLRDEPDAFRRFLPYRFACGAVEAYFTRYDNHRMTTVEKLELVTSPDLYANPIEQELTKRINRRVRRIQRILPLIYADQKSFGATTRHWGNQGRRMARKRAGTLVPFKSLPRSQVFRRCARCFFPLGEDLWLRCAVRWCMCCPGNRAAKADPGQAAFQ